MYVYIKFISEDINNKENVKGLFFLIFEYVMLIHFYSVLEFLLYLIIWHCIIAGDPSPTLDHLNKLIAFSTKTIEINFKQASISAMVVISLFMEPYLNVIKISVCNLEDLEVNFFNFVATKQNNLFQTAGSKQECWIHNPQMCQVILNAYILSLYVINVILHTEYFIL